MPMTKEDVQRWIRGFDAVAEADREALRQEAPRADWSIKSALPLLEAARPTYASSSPLRELRRREDAAVRATWNLLRRRLGK